MWTHIVIGVRPFFAGAGRGRGDLDGHAAGVVARAAEGRGELVDVGRQTSGPAWGPRGREPIREVQQLRIHPELVRRDR